MGVPSPFEPVPWVSLCQPDQEIVTDPIGGGAGKILGQDNERLWFLVCSENVTVGWLIWPSKQTGAGWGITPEQGRSHLWVSHPMAPGLIQGDWWLFNAGAAVKFHILTGRVSG